MKKNIISYFSISHFLSIIILVSIIFTFTRDLFANDDLLEAVSIKSMSEVENGNQLYIRNVTDINLSKDDKGYDYLSQVRSKVAIDYKILDNFYLRSNFKIAPAIKTNRSHQNNFFDEQALEASELFLSFENNKYAISIGKFSPLFGYSWRYAKGVWMNELFDEYRKNGKIGINSLYKVGNEKSNGLYEFRLALFKNDEKFLNNKLITRDDEIANKVGDHSSLRSYVASLDVKFDFENKFNQNYYNSEKLQYHFAYSKMHKSNSFLSSEKNYAYSVNYIYPLAKNFTINPMIEYIYVDNFDGSDVKQKNLNSSLIFRIKNNYLINFGNNYVRNKIKDKIDDRISKSEISFAYEFDKNKFFDKLYLGAGIKITDHESANDNFNNNSYGILIRYFKGF